MSYWVRPLTAAHCEALAPHVSEDDRLDLAASDHSPEVALASGLREPGEAWACGIDEDHILGAFGWTTYGTVWSMWRPLTLGEKKDLLRLAPKFIRAMVADAGGRTLGNIVAADNRNVRDWLNATGCITFLDTTLTWRDREYVPFIVTPHQSGASSHV